MDHIEEMEERRPKTKIDNKRSADCIRIMLATDCHIGVHGRDPTRSHDSLDTFREVLELAVKHDVDMILLAGDLFHENRPSRECFYETCALLRQYTFGDKPVSIELLSDPDDGKAPGFAFPAINYEDPNLNIAIPVFSIHGNHDDPQGAGGHSGALCALDQLSVSGLVNYIGKVDIPTDMDNADLASIVTRPVLLRKGQTRLALYGIGNVKDQRMHHQLRTNKISMFTPQDKDDWFNIMLLHQNRVQRGPLESVPEGMFDDSIDLIVWGHEHDCRIEPEPVAGKRYFISQPGSTVATSLSEGEAIPKHCALLEIQGKAFELTPIMLRTVRPFKMDTIHLAEIAEEEDVNLNDKIAINELLKQRIRKLVKEANDEFAERNENSETPVPPMLPLVRLRVDVTNVPEMSNPQRLGLEFQQEIANPRDVIHFIRAKRKATKNVINQPELEIDQLGLEGKAKVEKVRVGKLVQEFLSVQDMMVLGADGMNEAIELFVMKDSTQAIQSFIQRSERNMQKEVPVTEDMDDNGIESVFAAAREAQDAQMRQKKQARKEARDTNGNDAEAGSMGSVAGDNQSMQDEEEEEETPIVPPKRKPAVRSTPAPPAPKAKARATRVTTTKGKGKAKVVESDSEEENFDDIMDIDEVDDDDDEPEEMAPPPKKSRAKKTTPAPAPAKKAPAKRTTAKAKATQSTLSFAPSRSKSQQAVMLSDSD